MNSIALLKSQANFLLSLREKLELRNIRVSGDNTYQWERAKMIGMLDMARTIDVNIDEFRWVYSC